MEWKARFKGQYVLEQFGANGKECLFRKVLNRQDELEHFELVEDGKKYSVNLKNGMFTINGVEIFPITETELGVPLRNAKYRIIYYKRMQANFTVQKLEGPKIHSYLIGWQTTISGKNFKRVMQIFPDGKVFLQTDK